MASALRKLTLPRTAGRMLPSSRQRPHSVPSHRQSPERERKGRSPDASAIGTDTSTCQGQELQRNELGKQSTACRKPSGRSAPGSSTSPSSPRRRRWPPQLQGAALTRPGPPRLRRSLPDSDSLKPVVRRYDWLYAIPPRPFTWSPQVRSADGLVSTPTVLSL